MRVHVNGIRGKSSVTRLVAGVLREGGFVTVAKTTGSAARVIGPQGEETPIRRLGAATINEQIDIVKEHVRQDVEALVIECMAVRPLYQQYSQDYMVRSDITVITNVREDHQEEMGETLEEIADSMSVTIPHGGILITAEDRPHLRERLRRNAEARGSRMVYADASSVSDEDMRGFDYLQFKSNVAIGLAIADYLGISHERAVEGMWKSVPDVGVVRLKTYDILGKQITWVPMFAANDRESVILTLEQLSATFPPDATVVGILNNRTDRGRRAELFATMVPKDINPFVDHIITMGAYEDSVTSQMVSGGYPRERITNLGESVSPSLEQILERIAALVPGERGVLIGMVNIHTEQAEKLIHYFAERDGDEVVDELAESRDPSRAPAATIRMRRAQSRLGLPAATVTEERHA
ncbi:MAG: poly-gamma-glutamate synthase PgsB [Micrococcales bacterium]|nr:poly-gamma-glutamate synthase PgsB [Micrococcales bacterium]